MKESAYAPRINEQDSKLREQRLACNFARGKKSHECNNEGRQNTFERRRYMTGLKGASPYRSEVPTYSYYIQ
jgi:hypothetical protein